MRHPVDTGLVLATKTRARSYPVTEKIVTRRMIATPAGGRMIIRVSLPAISMHLAFLRDDGRHVVEREP